MTDSHRRNCIQRLSEQAIQDVHSSKNITSIEDVALSLIENSLDSKASKIEVTINRSRGNCVVGDNGCGIPPFEFLDNGGIGKMYWTSKRNDATGLEFPMHGTNGTFLTQLGNLSLLKISSVDTDGGQSSSLTINRGRVIHRRVNLEHNEDALEGRGTCIVVTDLFGSMPVRIKHRASQSSTHRQQSWHALKYQIAALLLAWPYPCSIRIQDEEDSSRTLRLAGNGPNTPATLSARSLKAHDGASITYNLQDVLSVLFQAEIAPWESRQNWIPVSATARSLRLDGMICSRPAPTKMCQFIALGVHPLDPLKIHDELYDCANRVFAKSSFGSVIEQTGGECATNIGQGRRSLNAAPLNTRGPVDRHAMFCFKFIAKDRMSHNVASETISPKSLQHFLDLLRLTITAWLEKHHFIKRKGDLQDSIRPDSTTSQDLATRKERVFRTAAKGVKEIALATEFSSNLERFQLNESVDASDHLPSLSAVRIGKPAPGLGNIVPLSREGLSFPGVPSVALPEGDATRGRVSVAEQTESEPAFDLPQTELAAMSVAIVPPDETSHANVPHESKTTESAISAMENEAFDWVDPVSKRTYKINARTGVTIPNSIRRPAMSRSAELQSDISGASQARSKSGGLSPCDHDHAKGSSIAGVLADWQNPVFERQKEEAITAAPTASLLPDKEGDHASSFGSSMPGAGAVPNGGRVASMSTTEMISREQLRAAKVIGQVDYKFILCKVQVPGTSDGPERAMLLLIDQHAASERIILEGLLREYGVPNMLPTGTLSPSEEACARTADVSRHTSYADYLYYDEISETERRLLQQYHEHFAAWGVLYELSDLRPSTPNSAEESTVPGRQSRVRVKNLPRAIVERCSSTPSLCIEMIRAEIYDVNRKPLSRRQMEMADSDLSADKAQDEAPLWLKFISFCPQGILDMLNSRACRTAVMFNDHLSQSECEDMVRELGLCVFPFVCAHGRKSVVPLNGLDMLPSEAQ